MSGGRAGADAGIAGPAGAGAEGRVREALRKASRIGAIALVAWLGPAACSHLSAPAPPEQQADDLKVPPEDAPPEFDVLVAHEFELDRNPEKAMAAYARALSKDPESIYVLKRLAELSARTDRLTDAVVYAERALALAPDDEPVRLFLGTLYRLRRDADAADRVLRDADGNPRSVEAAMLLYGALVDARRYPQARGVAEWLAKSEPNGIRGPLALADVLERQGDPGAAEAVLRDAISRHPDELTFYGALAKSRRQRGDRVGEIGVYREILARHPGHHATLLAKADAEIALGRDEDARATLEQVEKRYPDDLRTALRLAFLDYEADRYEAAAKRFREALEQQPEQHEVAYFLGVTLRKLNRDDEALEVLDAIPPEHDRYVDARVQIAGIYERRGDLAQALEELDRAEEVEESRPLDLYRASLMAKSGDVQGALTFLQSLLEDAPDDAEVLYNIGVIHGENQNVDEAIRYMQIVLGIDPNHAGALNYVGYTWAERGENLEQAEAMISKALEQRPDDGYITDSLGWVYVMRARPLLENGRTEEAQTWLARGIAELKRAAELTGGDPVISEHLGDAYLLKGEKEKALRSYEEAVRMEPRVGEQPDLEGKVERLRGELGR